MKNQRHRPRQSREQWQRIVERQAASGEPARAWCEANDVGYASFMKWRQQLREDGQAAPAPAFIELTDALAPATSVTIPSTWLVELSLAPGVTLRIAQPG
ncbi:MAG: transposase [Burkholderiaceae bacterium]